jgi:hypothetical protein
MLVALSIAAEHENSSLDSGDETARDAFAPSICLAATTLA